MNRSISVIGLVMCCLVAVACSGCVGGPGNQTVSPTLPGTPVLVGNLVVNESQNTGLVYMNQSKLITVRLAENPTTGFQWNLTTTPGLRIIKDEYIPSDTSGKMVGSGGTHVWDISTEMLGQQEIRAVYKRSWEPTTGNESTFTMTIMVT